MEDPRQQRPEGSVSSDDGNHRQQECFEAITGFLDRKGASYEIVHHQQTFTSEESARVRGVPLSAGGKALLLRVGSGNDEMNNHCFSLFVVSASRKLDSKAVKRELKKRGRSACKNIRFATREELSEMTGGLVPGCLPPFGKRLVLSPQHHCGSDNNDEDNDDDDDNHYLELYVDTSIAEENETIAFNAGSLTDSVIMSVADYLRVAAPTGIFTFSKA